MFFTSKAYLSPYFPPLFRTTLQIALLGLSYTYDTVLESNRELFQHEHFRYPLSKF